MSKQIGLDAMQASCEAVRAEVGGKATITLDEVLALIKLVRAQINEQDR